MNPANRPLVPSLALALLSLATALRAAPLFTQTDVFVSGQDGYHTYRIPAIETAPDGTLLAFAEARKHNAADPGDGKQDIDLVLKCSADQGATWSPMTVIEDPGEFWSAEDKSWRASVPGPGGAIQTRSGRLILPMWKAPYAVFTVFSDDQGGTWRRGSLVAGGLSGDENQVVELTDGRILMNIRQNSDSHRWLSESPDGGNTWIAPRPGLEVTPVACAIERFTAAGAGEDRDRLVWTGPRGPERRRLVMRTSYDEGRTFAFERMISEQYAAYSDLTLLKDRTIGVLWERGAERGYQFITFTRLNREWLEPAGPASTPMLDARPQVISRGEAAGTYQAFPDVCRLRNGELLCVFYGGYEHVSLPKTGFPKGGRICCVRSRDEGRTWSEPRVLFDGPLDDRDPHIAQMRNGTVLCSFFTYHPRADDPAPWDTCLVASRDGGETWDSEPRIVAAGWPSSAPVRELADGTRILGVYREEGGTAFGGLIRSTDAGQMWSEPVPIGRDSGVRLDAETDFVRLKDGTLYAALRGDRTNMHFAVSSDLGLSWSPVRDIGFPGHCPHFTRLGGGEILLTHRLPLTALHVSRDEGRTWQGPYEIDATPGAYASTVELRDGTVLAVYYEEGVESAVRARRFKLNARADGIEFHPLGRGSDRGK